MHGLYKSRKKMLASTLHLTTHPQTTTTHQKHLVAAVTAQRNTTTLTDGRPLRTQQCANALLHPNPKARARVLFSLFHFKPSKQPPPPGIGDSWSSRREARPAGHQDGDPSPADPRRSEVKLLRKEVIQPHLPVRLPCYDFVPIASPTFDRSPPCGLGHGLRVLPTFVT
jgi:hypothetical protein